MEQVQLPMLVVCTYQEKQEQPIWIQKIVLLMATLIMQFVILGLSVIQTTIQLLFGLDLIIIKMVILLKQRNQNLGTYLIP